MTPRVTAAWRLTILMLSLLTLAACTGTFEEGTPLVLLAATGGDASGADAAIVGFLVEPPGPARARAATALDSGDPAHDLAGDLTLPVRDWDWRDRDAIVGGPGAGRTELTVLTSLTASSQGQRQARLHRYDVSAFEATSPTLASLGAPLDLVVDGRWNDAAFPVEEGFEPLDGVCLVSVAVSGDGRYVALVDRRSACTASDAEVFLYLVDTVEPGLVWASTPADVAPVRPFIDQRAQTIDVLQRRASGYDLYRTGLASLRGPLPGTGAFATIDDARALVDVGGAGDERWLLLDGRLRTISDTGTVGPGVESATGSTRRLVPTDEGLPVVIAGGNDLWVHTTPTAEGRRFSRRYLDGATDSADRITYLVRPGGIDTLDLLVLTPDRPIGEVISPIYADASGSTRLAAPRLLTWFRPPVMPTP